MSNYILAIPDYIPRSPNASARKHYGRTMDESRFWNAVIGQKAYENQVPRAGIITGFHAFVTITIQKPGKVRLRDKDNLYASVKHLLDALTRLRIIEDDNPRHCTLHVVEENGHKKYATIISIEYTNQEAAKSRLAEYSS